MNCRKARRLLNSHDAIIDMELINHIKSCPSCARLASAERMLESALHSEKNAQPDPETPMQIIRAKVETLSRQRTIEEKTIMSRFRSEFSRRPRLIAGFGLALVAFLFVTLVPFPYTKTVGYKVAFENVGAINNKAVNQLVATLNAMGYADIGIVVTDAGFNLLRLPTREAAREVAIAFQKVTGTDAEPDISRMTEKVSGSLYAQVVEKQRTIEIESEGKSDAEIESEIVQKLTEAGYQSNVSVTTDANGQREIKIMMDKQDSNAVEQENIILKCGDTDKVGIGLPMKVDVDTEGKTDNEICAEVKAKLAEQGITDAQVTVSTDPDGKRKIEVKVEKEEQR